jgi:2-polyprenyl-3-methyl-5-hydroxy-6-metoxy-1,4-benzoquinol methylase
VCRIFFRTFKEAQMMVLSSKLALRDMQPEIMDQPGLETAEHQNALRGLARINGICGSAGALWRPIRRLAEAKRVRPLRVLDVGTGGGDVLIRLQRRARRAGLSITFAGADVSLTAIEYARQNAQHADEAIDFFQLDALRCPLPDNYDVIMCSLFLHHLAADQAVDLLRRMGQAANSMVLVNDLVRSRLGYLLAWLGTRVLTTSPLVRFDGPLSVRAAFTMAEARQLAQQAGLRDATISRRWPFRFLLEWRRQP